MTAVSERQRVAYRLADKVVELELNTPFGGYEGQEEKTTGKPHTVLFSKPATLDGSIRVFSPKFIHIKWVNGGKTRNAVIKSEDDAEQFLRLAFVDNKLEEAMELADS